MPTLLTLALSAALFLVLVASCAAPGDAAAASSRFRASAYQGGAGDRASAGSPLSMEELELLKKTVLLTEDDVAALRMSRDVLEPHVEEILDTWYGFVGANEHLLASFSGPDGPDTHYLAEVRKRFGRWILDTAAADYDQDWLDFQHEIGLRHHRTKKNRVDGANAADQVAFRYVVALASPVTVTLRPFLERGGHSREDVNRMHAAWTKSVLLQVILWSYPYVNEGDF